MNDPRILEFDPETEGPEEARRAYRRELAAFSGERARPGPGALGGFDGADRSAGSPAERDDDDYDDDDDAGHSASPVPENDVRHSRRFAAALRDRARYCPELEAWLLWEPGRGWVWDRAGGIMELAKEHALSLVEDCAAIPSLDARLRALQRANAYAQEPRLRALLALARSDPRLVAPVETIDADPWRAGVEGGSLDLRAGVFSPPDPALLLTKRLGAPWDPAAACPVWEGFLTRVIPDAALRRFLQASAGYSLTGVTREHCFWFLHGAGSNGKTTFVETLQALFHDYGQSAAETMISVHLSGSGPKAELARLPGVRFLAGSEVSQGARLNEGLIKGLTGGDTMTGEAKYCAPFNFKPALKFWMFGNHRPVIAGTDLGIWRRVRLIPFHEEIRREERDPRLGERLREELPGILNWALAGLRDWLANGFLLPDAVAEATAGYREESDVLGAFLTEHIRPAPGCSLTTKEVYQRYTEWCAEEGLKHPLTHITFNARLTDRGYHLARTSGVRKWRDAGWAPEHPALRSPADEGDG